MKETKFSVKKKILASASMLTVSAIMLSSATYAWFTMNTDVTVSGFQLTAKADSTYLIVGPESTAAALQAVNRKNYEFSPVAELQVFPSAHTDSLTNTATAGANTEGVMSNWYFKYADVPTASGSTTAAHDIASNKFETDYVLHRTVYVTLAEGSGAATNLRCTGATFTTTDVKTGQNEKFDAVTVVVTSSSAYDEEDKGSNFSLAGTQLAATVTDQDVVALDIWIYYNGNDASVFTNNIKNLEGATLELQFSVDYAAPVNANP